MLEQVEENEAGKRDLIPEFTPIEIFPIKLKYEKLIAQKLIERDKKLAEVRQIENAEIRRARIKDVRQKFIDQKRDINKIKKEEIRRAKLHNSIGKSVRELAIVGLGIDSADFYIEFQERFISRKKIKAKKLQKRYKKIINYLKEILLLTDADKELIFTVSEFIYSADQQTKVDFFKEFQFLIEEKLIDQSDIEIAIDSCLEELSKELIKVTNSIRNKVPKN